jgi:hypothetical protein
MPAVAATDRPNPMEWISRGSMSRSAPTASVNPRSRLSGRPAKDEPATTSAIAVARSTDGSNRVSSAKKASTTALSTKRGASEIRRSRGRATIRTKATF